MINIKIKLKIITVIALVISNLLAGFPGQAVISIAETVLKDIKVVDTLYWATKDSKVVDSLVNSRFPRVIKEAKAATNTYDFSDCGATCDTDAGWWASDDGVDVFPFANNSANRNNHTENVDADYTALSSSNDSRFVSQTAPASDEIFLWFEMTISEPVEDIAQIDFTYEGFTTATTNFSIYVKDNSTAFQNNSGWRRVGAVESIAASTEESFTRSLVSTDFANLINSSGLIIWGVTEVASAVAVTTDYVSLTVHTNTVEQEGFRWRNDDGSETTATWIASQDTNITQPTATNTRLRTILNDTSAGNQASTQYQLEYKLSSDSVYRPVQASSGSVAFGSSGTASAGGTTVINVPYPTTVNVGDLLILTVANKLETTTPATPTGWTAASNYTATGGAGSAGADSGNIRMSVFIKEADGSEDNDMLGMTINGNAAIGRMFRYTKGTGKEWEYAIVNGADNTPGTSWSVTAGSDPGITAGDIVLVASASNSDGPTWSAEAISATGVTFGTATERQDSGITTGNDLDMIVSDHVVSSGTSSAAPVYTMTASTSGTNFPAGPSVFVRIRQVDAPIQLGASSNIGASGAATTAQLTAPAGGPTFTAGRIQDDENPADAVDINDSQYTEMEWSLIATSQAADAEVYQFRVTANGQVLTDYTVTPQWTIGTPAGGSTFTLSTYRFYTDNDGTNPTDPWGAPDLGENTLITTVPATNDSPEPTDELRLRVAITIGGANLSASSQQFKLQYKAGTDASCTTGSWTDVGAGGGGAIWRFASSSVTDGTDLTAAKISVTDVLEEYIKSNPTGTNPNAATVGQDIEYDFHLEHNGAADATTYSFRVVESDGTVFSAYTNCPTLETRPGSSNLLRHGAHFVDNSEKGFIW